MKKHITISSILMIVVFLSLIGKVNIVHADSAAFWPPECALNDTFGERDASGKRPANTCNFFSENFTLDDLDILKNIAYVYRRDFCITSSQDFSLSTSTSVELKTNPYKCDYDYFAFAKSKLPGSTGSLDPMSIFGTSTATDEVYTGDQFTIPVLDPSLEVQKGRMDFFVAINDEYLGLSAVGSSTAVISDQKFIKLDSLSINPYRETPVTDPRKEVHLFYSPLGIYGGNKIILYKSKEVQTLDDGSQKTITFLPPHTEGITPLNKEVSNPQDSSTASSAPNSTSSALSISSGWFSGFWCFIKGIFGRSC